MTSEAQHEASLIGAVLFRPDLIDEVEITDADFQTPDYRLVWRAATEMHRAGKLVDAIEVSMAMPAPHLQSLVIELAASCPSAANGTSYAREVRSASLLREIRILGLEMTNATGNPADLLATYQSRLSSLTDSSPNGGYRGVRDVVRDLWTQMQIMADRDGDVTGLATPWPSLDRMTAGLHPGELVIVAARPSMGKSAFGAQIAAHAATGPGAAIVTLEMGAAAVLRRLVSAQSGIQAARLRRPAGLTDDDWAQLNGFATEVRTWRLWMDDQAGMSAQRLSARLRALHRREGLGVAVVDYLGLMEIPRGDNRAQAVGEVTRALKLLAAELQIPIVLLAQLNRGVESRADKRPTLADLRDSGAIEQDADVILFVHREGRYRANAPQDWAEIIVAKQREGETGTAYLRWDGAHVAFREPDSDDVPPVDQLREKPRETRGKVFDL